jgi:hypothetical protein
MEQSQLSDSSTVSIPRLSYKNGKNNFSASFWDGATGDLHKIVLNPKAKIIHKEMKKKNTDLVDNLTASYFHVIRVDSILCFVCSNAIFRNRNFRKSSSQA